MIPGNNTQLSKHHIDKFLIGFYCLSYGTKLTLLDRTVHVNDRL